MIVNPKKTFLRGGVTAITPGKKKREIAHVKDWGWLREEGKDGKIKKKTPWGRDNMYGHHYLLMNGKQDRNRILKEESEVVNPPEEGRVKKKFM